MQNKLQHNISFSRDELAHAYYMMLDYCASWKPSKPLNEEDRTMNLKQYRSNLAVLRKIGVVAENIGVKIEVEEIEEVAP
jgi:hypothetical protein